MEFTVRRDASIKITMLMVSCCSRSLGTSLNSSSFKAASGGETRFDFKPAEKQSLNKMDARGITEILGALGDCRIGIEDIEVKTFVPRDDDTTCSDSWDQLKRGSSGAAIAFGSAQVNGLTKAVLKSQRVRFEICSTGQSITIDHDAGPKVFKISDCRDFAIQAKIRVTAGTVGGFCFVFAGLGPLGTVKACAHLVNTIRETSRQYGNAPFIRVLSVPRGGQLEADQIEVIAEGAIGRGTYWQCVWHPRRSWKIWRQFCAVRAHGMPLTTEGDAILRSLRWTTSSASGLHLAPCRRLTTVLAVALFAGLYFAVVSPSRNL